MIRSMVRSWKDKPYNYSYRIRWYEMPGGVDIRLNVETPNGAQNEYPRDRDAALERYTRFMQEHRNGGS